MDREEMIARFAKFLREYVDDEGNEVYINRLKDLLTVTPKRSLAIDWAHLNSFDPELADELLNNPEEAIASAEDAIQIVLREPPLLVEREFKVHARFYNLPKTLLVKELGSEHINKLIQVEGIITRVSEVKPFVEKAVFVCRDCGNEMVRLQRPYENLVKPAKCDACGSRNIELDVDKSRFLNFQSFRLQDRPESLKGGQMPRFVDAILLDDLVDAALPGDRVLVTGVLRVILEQREKRPIFKKILEVNHIEQLSKEIEELEISPEDEQKIRELAKRKDIVDAIVDSIAPAIWGHRIVKKGIALALFGGVQRTLPDGTKLRGESHVLLVGDPGVAKSQLLRYVANLAPRAIYTSGKSSSAAGLCVAPDSLIITDSGIQEIGPLVEEWMQETGSIEYSEGIFYTPYFGESPAFESTSTRAEESVMSRVWKIEAPEKLVRVKTITGKEITTTPETKLLTFNGTFEWKEAREIKPEDHVVTLRKIRVKEKPIYTMELLKDLDDLVLYGVKKEVKHLIEKITKEKGLTKRELAKTLGVSESMLYYNWVNEKARGNITMKHLKRLVELAEEPLHSIHPPEVALQDGKRIKIPMTIDEKFAYFIGLVAGDGDVSKAGWGVSVRFSNGNREMRGKFKELVKELFAINAKESREKDRVPAVRFHSKIVAHVLNELGVPLSPKSNKLDIPPKLFNAPKNVLAAYIRGLFDCDGAVIIRNNGSSYIELDTVSEKLARKLQLALLRFGIVSHLRKRVRKGKVNEINGRKVISKHDRWELKIYGENILLFAREIGFEHPEKKEKLVELVERIHRSKKDTNVDVVPGVGKIIREIRKFYGMSIENLYGSNIGSTVERGKTISRALLRKVISNLEKAEIEAVPVKLPNDLRRRIGEALKPSELGLKREEFYELFRRERNRAIRYGLLAKATKLLSERDEKAYRELIWILSEVAAREKEMREKIEFLRRLVDSEVLFEKVKETEQIETPYDYVYDLTVEGSHSFIANGFVVHNTAAAVRDEFTGSWVLEAGVLVLADGGFACLHPDSRVLVDGKYQRIEDLFELQKSYKARSGNEIVDIQEKNMEVVALDLSTMKTRKSTATIIRRKPWKGDLIRLKLRSGNEITLTPDHLLIDGNTLEWKEAEKFKVGDEIQTVDETLNPKAGEIVSIERVPYEGYVYDLYVPGEHNFIAEGIIVHNCIDEFDKMSDRDRSAIHEALEQQSYHHDFELLLADGRKVKIGELVDELIEKNRDKVILGKDTEILPVDDIELLAYDLEKKEIVKVKADRVSRHKAPERFIRLRFSNGREITVTPDHPVMVWENGEITEKPTEKITPGDIALGVLKYPIQVDGKFKERYRDMREAEDYQDHLYSLGVVSKIKRTGIYFTVEKAERALPRELVKPLINAGKILRVTQTPKERASFNQKLVKESIIEGYLQRVIGRMNELERLSRDDPAKALELLPKTQLYYRYGITYGKLKKLAEARNSWAEGIIQSAVAERISLAKRELEEFFKWWNANVNFLKVKHVEDIKNDGWEWVYDVTVEPHHLFVSHGLVLHNTISISKAGITATLNSRTTVIAAANPKFGRFNRHKSLPEQLDLPPTLLSRFDLIFLLLDEPDEKVDASIAEHILKVRRGEAEAVTPKIPYDLLKKYIAYARKNVHPVLSREAMEEIKRYYVRMRKGLKRGDEDGVQPIPITARQLEALIRLSEAHARMRLSETVTREDARAAIEIIEAMMKTIAVDEEGNLDVSILEVGKSSKKINKIEKLVDIIKSLESEGEFGAPEEKVIEAAKQAGIGTKADIEKLLNELKSDGRVYEPRAGFYRVI